MTVIFLLSYETVLYFHYVKLCILTLHAIRVLLKVINVVGCVVMFEEDSISCQSYLQEATSILQKV